MTIYMLGLFQYGESRILMYILGTSSKEAKWKINTYWVECSRSIKLTALLKTAMFKTALLKHACFK